MQGVIDIWCNLFTPSAIRRGWVEAKELADIVRWWHFEDRIKGMEPAEFIAMMDEFGVEKVCIPSAKMRSYQTGEMLWDYSVEEVADLVREYPGRIVGLYGIDPRTKMTGVAELETAVKQYGFKGAHLHTYGFGLPLNHRDYFPFYAKCAELGVPVEMQTGHSAEFMPSALAQPILLDDIALYFRDLKLIGAHTGWPWVEELIAMAWKHPNVFVGTSMHAPKYWDPSLIRFINTRGREKVMFGTDYPGLHYRDALPQVEALGLREEAKRNLLRETAVRVFNLE